MIEICSGVLALAIVALAILVLAALLALSDGDLTLMFFERAFPGTVPARLANKVVWITGASSGIGRGLAVKLATVQCRLILSARREPELNRVKNECIAAGLKDVDVLVVPLDVTDIARHHECLRKILDHFGKLDILVNNAGRSQRANFEDVDIQVDRDLFELNVFSQVALTNTVLREHFLERKSGHVVVTSSIAGKLGIPMSRSYDGSKHALHGYFECLATEHPYIDITMVCPGPVVSEIVTHAFTAKPNEVFGKKHNSDSYRMSADRCAHLMAVAMANRLTEAWISPHPSLILFYVNQYMPSIARQVMRRIGVTYLKKMRDGELEENEPANN